MTNNKEKYAFWLTPEAKKMVESDVTLGNCGSQSEFVEKAVRFCDDYNKMRGNSVREINSTRGTISLKDVIREDNYD